MVDFVRNATKMRFECANRKRRLMDTSKPVKEKVGLGVYKLESGKFSAELGLKELGEFDSIQEAATKYNSYITDKFVYPIYNNRGEIPVNFEAEVLITIDEFDKNDVPIQYKEAFNKYINAVNTKEEVVENEQTEIPVEILTDIT